MTLSFEEAVSVTGPIDSSLSMAENMEAAYKRYREIVGACSVNETLTCVNCDQEYREEENTTDSCTWYSRNHKGIYLTDYDSDAWYGWHEGNPPKESAYWKINHAGQGGHKWSVCGCTGTNDECERVGKHVPFGYPPSDDDWEEDESRELSDDEFDVPASTRGNQDLLLRNYKAKLGYAIHRFQNEANEKVEKNA